MDNQNIKIPLIMAMDEAEKELVNVVNRIITDYKLPAYLIENIIDKIHCQIKEAAKQELVNAKNEYARKCAEETKNAEAKV